MTRILQCLVWITVMTALGHTQRSYPSRSLQNPRSIIFPESTHENYQHQNHRQTEQQPELIRRKNIQNKISEEPSKIHLSKRGAIESELSRQVVFPGASKTKFELEVPEPCKKLGYCESIPPNYPMDAIRRLISQLGDTAGDKFKMDKLDTDSVQISQRFGSEESNGTVCNSHLTVSIPYLLPDKEGVWWQVLQFPQGNMTQGIRTEKCLDDKCSGVDSIQDDDYKCKCEQIYAFRELYTVEIKLNTTKILLKKRLLKVPTCCSCVIFALDNY